MKSILPLTLSLLLSLSTALQAKSVTLWLGTGGPAAEGIYTAQFNTEKGTLSPPQLAIEANGPGWITFNSDGTRLYAVGKIDEPCVVAYAVNDDDTLTLINHQPIGDGGSCHVSLDQKERILFSAQYGGGSVAAFAINEDGSIGEQTALIEHTGSGPNPDRQEAPHPHWTGVSPDNRFLFIPDLGNDKVIIYKIDHENQSIEPHGYGETVPGGGPRHMKFSKDGSKIYLLNELLLSVTVFEYDAEAGTMEAIQTIANVPEEDIEIPSKASEIRIHPNGKFAYAANRGHDTITVFSIDEDSGKLSVVECEPVRGSFPRNFNFDPTGSWLIAGGQLSNTLSVFSVDANTGELVFSSIKNSPAPICITYPSDDNER